jgi:hypothetical protein
LSFKKQTKRDHCGDITQNRIVNIFFLLPAVVGFKNEMRAVSDTSVAIGGCQILSGRNNIFIPLLMLREEPLGRKMLATASRELDMEIARIITTSFPNVPFAYVTDMEFIDFRGRICQLKFIRRFIRQF